MFAGIIKEIGTLEDIRPKEKSRTISVKADALSEGTAIGNSVSVDGACLTVVDRSQGVLYFDVIDETLKNTTLGYIKKRQKVNLEPSLKVMDGISGHLVTGHIDEIGRINRMARFSGGVMQLMIGISPKNAHLLVQKGSVAVNGISLTVNGIGRDFFTVDIIPYTFRATTMYATRLGDKVNIEFDIVGKYVLSNLSKVKEYRG